MKSAILGMTALFAGAAASPALSQTVDHADAGSAHIHLVGNTSSNSSSNTSSDSGSHGSSYVRTHRWSVESDDGYRRRSIRGGTRIERYAPPRNRKRRFRSDDDD